MPRACVASHVGQLRPSLIFFAWCCCCMVSFAVVAEAIQCDLYMANSTIPNAGLGLFSATERRPGDKINGDVCIPIMDLWLHHPHTFNPFEDYNWGGEFMGMGMETGTVDIEAFCPGLDCVINSNLALLNVDKATPVFDAGGLHRSIHPGAGAISPYHNGTTRVRRQIPPGGELFKSYGDEWFVSRTDLFGALPLTKNFQKADRLLKKYKRMFQTLKLPHDGRLSKDLFEMVLLGGFKTKWNKSRNMNALPETWDDFVLAMQSNSISAIHQPNATRSLDWLAEHGKCVDHIEPRQSTLDGAGRGAFAKRHLPKGTVITGSPLHAIPFKETFLDVYKVHIDETGKAHSMADWGVIGKQVLMNYCFGHADTSMLLCPYGSGINYINHNKTLVNVAVRWAQHGSTGQNNGWFDKTPTEIASDTKSQLGLDYIALRDIQQGEELFLDYGTAWEDAWTSLNTDWKMEHSWANTYLNGHDWNEMFGDMPLRTMKEEMYDPYPTALHKRCHVDLEQEPRRWQVAHKKWSWKPDEYGHPCAVLGRTKATNATRFAGDYVYTVEITTEPVDRTDSSAAKTFQATNVPRAAIRFFDWPYTTDLHLRNAFRHEIGLPDDLMQDAWRNKKRQPSQSKGAQKEQPAGPGGGPPSAPTGPALSSGGAPNSGEL